MALSEGKPYNKATVNLSAPPLSGVYGIFRSNAWIYWGEAINIRDRLTQHLDSDYVQNPCIPANAPTGFCYELVAGGKEARVQRQDYYILSHGSLCNRKIGS